MPKNQKDKRSSCCSTLNKLLTLLDLFGQSPQFTILQKEKFTSKIGLFSTLIVNAICLSYFLFQVKALVERQNPSVVQYDTQLLESGEIPLVMSNFSLAVTLNDANSLPLDRKYFNVTIQNCARVKTRNQTTNEMTISNNCVTYPTETCITDHFVTQVQKDYVANIFLPSTVCIQRDAWQSNPPKLQGVVASSVQKFISVQISVFRNSTIYKGCPPIEEIQEHMKSGFYAVLMNDNLLNMDNPTSPLNQMLVVHRTTFSISTSRSIYQTFKIIDSITDLGLISQDYQKVEGIIQNSWSETSEYYNQAFLINQLIGLDFRRSNYQRNYIKLQSILGYVGGLLNILVLVFKIILTPIVQQMMNITMANKLFRFQDDDYIVKNQIVEEIDKKRLQSQRDSVSLSDRWKYKFQGWDLSEKNFQGHEITAPLSSNQQLKSNFFDVISLTFGCKKKLRDKLNYAKQRFSQKLDIAFIISKLYELDKMKYILFTNDQLDLFNLLPKPIITSDLLKKEVLSKFPRLDEKKLHTFILEERTPKNLMFEKAYESFKQIQQKEHKSSIDHHLLQSLDEDLFQLFSKLMVDENMLKINDEFESIDGGVRQVQQTPIIIKKID